MLILSLGTPTLIVGWLLGLAVLSLFLFAGMDGRAKPKTKTSALVFTAEDLLPLIFS